MARCAGIRFLLAILLATPFSASAQEGQRPLTVDDLMALNAVSDPQVSPDGNWVAYMVRSRDMDEDKSNTQIWMVPFAGGEPIAMTAVDSSATDPRWSPDNRFLAFKASKGEEEKPQVWSLNRLGGEAVQLTNVKQGISSFEWSPDSSRLLLLIRDPEPADLTEDKEDDEKLLPHVIDRMQFKEDYVGYLDRRREHIYVYTPGDEEPVQLTFGDFDDTDPVWSPDGRSIAFVSDRSDDPDLNYGTDIFVVSVDGGEHTLTRVTSNPGLDHSPAYSPDGNSIAYITSTGFHVSGSALSPTFYLAETGIGADQRHILTPDLDRNILDPEYSPDGRNINFFLEDSGVYHLGSVPSGGGDIVRMVSGDVDISEFDINGGRIVIAMSQADHPTEIFAYESGELKRLTHVTNEALDGIARAGVEKLQFTSADGTPVEAFLVKPLNYTAGTRYPTILWLHGGPDSQYTFAYDETAQLLAANGYAVILPNPRGSVGYGSEFAQGIIAAWGKNDYADVMAAMEHGIQIGIVDPDRLGVGGWSYGGILTNYVITQTQQFKAAVSGASLGLFTANYGHDQYQLGYELEFGLPWERGELWNELSPFNSVENITTPTLWMGGDSDWNVPILNSEQMYIAMKRLGRETLLVVYPGEHHGIRRPSFQKDRLERWLSWFDRYLKPETASDNE